MVGYQQWLVSAGCDNGLTVVPHWPSVDCSRQQLWLVRESPWSWSHHVFLGQQRLGRKSQNVGSELFILTCEWVRMYSQIQDSHTPAHARICVCAWADPAVAFLPSSCRGGSAHVDCWLSNPSGWWTPAPVHVKIQTEFYLTHVNVHISRDKLLCRHF